MRNRALVEALRRYLTPGWGDVQTTQGQAASGASANPVRVAVIGASESAKNAMCAEPWGERFVDLLNEGGINEATCKNLAYHGATYFQALNSTFYGTNTMVQETILYQPQVVFVSLGGNDIMNAADGRTLAQVKTDADTLFSALRAGLPSALIIAVLPRAHDNTNFPTPGVTLKNKAIASQFMELPAAGILTALWTSEMLETAVSAGGVGGVGGKTRVADLESLASYINTGPSTSFNIIGSNWIRMDFWKLQRLGCTLPDMAHHNIGAHQWMAASVYKQAKLLSAFTALFPKLSNQIVADWQDPDSFFSYYLTSSGDGWVRAAGAGVPGLNAEDMQRFWGDQVVWAPEEFYLPFKTRFATWPAAVTVQNTGDWPGTFRIMLRNGPPTQLAYLSIDGGAFVSSGESTDTHGNFETTVNISVFVLSVATHVLRIKCGTECYGPFNVVVTAPFNQSNYSAASNTTGFTATGAQVAGARDVVLNLTGALGGAANIQLPTAANIVAAIPGAFTGQSYRLRVINSSSGAFAWTATTNTGLTLTGTMSIAQNTWRDFVVTLTSLAAVSVQSVGVGTQS